MDFSKALTTPSNSLSILAYLVLVLVKVLLPYAMGYRLCLLLFSLCNKVIPIALPLASISMYKSKSGL